MTERRHLDIEDLYALRAVADLDLSPDGERIAFTLQEADRDQDRDVPHVWVVGAGGGEPVQWTRGERGDRSPRWSPDGRRLAFLSARGGEDAPAQVWAIPAGGGEPARLTDAPGGVQEFGWSPDGSRIAYLAVHSRAGAGAPRVVRRLGYKADGVGPVAGAEVQLFVTGGGDGEPVQLTDGEVGVSAFAWSPEGERLALVTARHDRWDLDRARHVFIVPAGGGEATRLTDGPCAAVALRWTPDGAALLVLGVEHAIRDVQATLWLVDAGGGAPRPLLPGFDRSVLGGPNYPGTPPAVAAGSAVFAARVGGRAHVFRVPLAGGQPQVVLGGEERVVSGLSVAADRLAAVVADPSTPGDVFTVELSGGAPARLTDVNRDVLGTAAVVRPELRRFVAPDGLVVEGYLWRAAGPGSPPSPLLLDIHGGPHSATAPALHRHDLYRQALAARGWAVLSVNPRGSDGYGHDFMRAVNGGWGRHDEPDFMAAVDALVADGTADPERLAVTGYSYGGFSTSWLAGRTDRFRAAVVGGGITDTVSQLGTSDVSGLNRAFGVLPYERWDLYEDLSPLRRVERVTMPVLILHGEADLRCPIGQGEMLFVLLRFLGREVEMVRYPGASHLFIVSGRLSHRADYQSRLVEWVERWTLADAGVGDRHDVAAAPAP